MSPSLYIVPFTYHDLIEACEESGCPICYLSQKLVAKYLKMLFYDSGNDPEIRDRIRRRKGFCYEHSWLVLDARLGSALALAIVSRDLVQSFLPAVPSIHQKANFLAKIKGKLQTTKWQTTIDKWLTPQEPCLACQQHDLVEERIVKTFIESLEKENFLAVLKKSDGICRPHLHQLLASPISPNSAEKIIKLTTEKWGQLSEELTEFIRKHDFRYSKEEIGIERDSYKRAIAALVGNKLNTDYKP